MQYFLDALKGTRDACLLGELFCRRPVLTDPVPSLRRALRPDAPVVCSGFGLDRWIVSIYPCRPNAVRSSFRAPLLLPTLRSDSGPEFGFRSRSALRSDSVSGSRFRSGSALRSDSVPEPASSRGPMLRPTGFWRPQSMLKSGGYLDSSPNCAHEIGVTARPHEDRLSHQPL